jgi:predicted RNA-binding protein associated with RNAse of E/G family
VSPVVSRQLVEILDTRSATRILPLAPDQVLEQALDRWHETDRCLCTTVLSPEDPFVLAETCWYVPDHGLRLRRRRPRAGDPATATTEIGAVRIVVDGGRWRCTDLLLGLEVVPGRPARVVHDADFAAAVAGGVLSGADADEAMSTVHRVLGELVGARHDPDAWACSLGISSLVRS